MHRSKSTAKRRALLPVALFGCASIVYFTRTRYSRLASSGRRPRAESGRVLSLATMNEDLRDMEYAVRGAVPIRAEEIMAEIRQAEREGRPNPYNFSETLGCNIGNPQAVGQPPVTWYRQVLGLVDSPTLLAEAKKGALAKVIPSDVVARAEELADAFGSTGAYTHSQGSELVRRHVCDFIETRDGGPRCDPGNIFLLNGASSGIDTILQTLITSPDDAVMVPIPQYPIYSAHIKLYGGRQVGYYLDEGRDWGLSIEELRRSINRARADGARVRALVIINPGNPTGNVLSKENLEQVVRFCKEERLVLMADEVYQENVYVPGRKFVSARSVAASMGQDFANFELVSFHSTSKGFIGECGRRGGYMELWGFDPEVQAQIYKLQSSQLCSNVDGQIMTDLMVKPPRPGEPSYARFKEENDAIFQGLREKAKVLVTHMNSIDGVSSNLATGAMYAFVKIDLPPKAVAAAREQGMAPDLMYCLSLLESTGIITVPGSGFGQVDGEYHFRTTFLPPRDRLFESLEAFSAHHREFMSRYA